MKRILIITSSLLMVLLVFAGCTTAGTQSDSTDDGSIVITPENAEDYLEMNLEIERFDYNSMNGKVYTDHESHNAFIISGDINGISGYRYENVELTIECIVNSDVPIVNTNTKGREFKTTVSLSSAGNATVEEGFQCWIGKETDSTITYKIVEASGTVYH
ncbi:MAG: hypothetical protein IJR60_03265 [Eubacterium sp.]|nr:hypothetical protein [Eubacterium sp.]